MDREDEIVIGREMAAAQEAERLRMAGDPPPSPLPPERYDAARGDFGLFDIEPVALDAALTAFVREYREASAARRAALRDGTSLDDAYTLLTFARRAAVFALRGADPTLVQDGLSACAAIGYERIDARDGLVALALLHHAAGHCGLAPEEAFTPIARLGEPLFARLLEGFLERPARDRDLREAWGYTEVEGPLGAGFLGCGYEQWSPTVDLVGVSLRVAAALRGDDYVIDDPQLAAKLSAIWLSAAGDPALESMLEHVRGAVVVHGRLRPETHSEPHSQQLTAWVVEARDGADAARLAELARTPRAGDALVGLAAGPLFVLVVARSVVMGVDAYEDSERMARFTPRLRAALDG